MTDFTHEDECMMRRCFALAKKGGYHVRTNPQVGAVIVVNGRIIGEGYHQEFGGPHAEVNALNAVPQKERHLLSESHLYVSLEPCNHHGKTPPCVDAIIKAGIPKVTISNIDPNEQMSGQSVVALASAGIDVRTGLLKEEGFEVIRKFLVLQKLKLPYIILKWAQSKDGYIGHNDMQVWLSNEQSMLLVHQWREECDAIMVGTSTVITDNPTLTNRRGTGRSPDRIILDRTGRIPRDANVYTNEEAKVFLFSTMHSIKGIPERVSFHQLSQEDWSFKTVAKFLYEKGYSSIIVEGGAKLHASLIEDDLWHEGRVIHTPQRIYSGIKAPIIKGELKEEFLLDQDKILIFNNLKIDQKLM